MVTGCEHPRYSGPCHVPVNAPAAPRSCVRLPRPKTHATTKALSRTSTTNTQNTRYDIHMLRRSPLGVRAGALGNRASDVE